MLHEILLSLAGHHSPLLRDDLNSSKRDIDDGLQLSSSERQLLKGVALLSQYHRNLKRHLRTIAQNHSSVVCRAVANSILQVQLRRFNDAILEVEANILCKDASIVGAYDIVPLAFVVGHFDAWQRPMAWLWDLSIFMMAENAQTACTGAALIDRLRSDAHTGFPDIEKIALELSTTAELAWLKQLATWLLHGTVSEHGATDFFIQKTDKQDAAYRKLSTHTPKFVTGATGRSILFIGRSIGHILNHKQGSSLIADPKFDNLTTEHMKMLTGIAFPITSAQLSQTIASMRSSLSRNALQDLLPTSTTRLALQTLQRYLLLSNTDFASCLINEAERRRDARWETADKMARLDPIKALQGLSLKDSEVSQILRQTWKAMVHSSYQDIGDDALEYAQKHVVFTAMPKQSSRPSTADSAAAERPIVSPTSFNDLLLGTPTVLSMRVASPLNLLLSSYDIDLYSAINAYLLAVKRAQLRLENLWRRHTIRRRSPPSHDAATLRRAWATSSSALLLLSELGSYFGASVIQPACSHFLTWACSDAPKDDALPTEADTDASPQDPESIAAGHRTFLDVLIHGLLLADVAYTKQLRTFLTGVDQLSALFIRWLEAQETDGVQQGDFHKGATELARASQKSEHDRKVLISCLREMHTSRAGEISLHGRDTGGYKPVRLGGLDHLLMKLEFEGHTSSVSDM